LKATVLKWFGEKVKGKGGKVCDSADVVSLKLQFWIWTRFILADSANYFLNCCVHGDYNYTDRQSWLAMAIAYLNIFGSSVRSTPNGDQRKNTKISKEIKMMTNDTEQLILDRLQKIDDNIEPIKTDVNQINVQISKIETNLNWIKILFPIAFTFIIFLLGLLIKIIGNF
jgi:hypothetical protein